MVNKRPVVQKSMIDGSLGYLLRSEGPLNLDMSLNSGQAFRWRKVDDVYEGIIYGKQVRLTQPSKEEVFVFGPASRELAEFVASYLALDIDQSDIEERLAACGSHLQKAVELSSGLRTLRQEPWETSIAFIISANNGVANITRVIENLSSSFGDRLEGPFGAYNAFPKPEQLVSAGHDGIWSCKAGFRTRGICEAAAGVLDGSVDLELIESRSYEVAKKQLIALRGIGEKVADCILLFSMGKYEAFPVDVWIERIVRLLYFNGSKLSHKEIRRWAAEEFGDIAGFANQFLFNYGRKFAATSLKRDEIAARAGLRDPDTL